MKKSLIVCCMVILSLFAVGCEKTIELTDEENYLIAEYAAELLLKYSDNYTYKFYDDNTFVSPHEYDTVATGTDASEELITTEEAVTEETTEELISEDASTEGSGTGNDSEGDNHDWNNTTPINMEDVTEDSIEVDYQYKDFDLASFVGLPNASITYQYAMITETYPSYDSSGMYIEVQAPQGYKLLVLKFRVENITNETQEIDLYDKDIGYRIIVDNSKSAKQMFTILIDDLYTYQNTLSGSALEEAVLLFQISNTVADQMKDIKLQVEYNDEKAIVQLQ
ncbi:MAG: hypothetical protein ACI4D8_05655 [Wujia sp.]